jgi:hypothetical protein
MAAKKHFQNPDLESQFTDLLVNTLLYTSQKTKLLISNLEKANIPFERIKKKDRSLFYVKKEDLKRAEKCRPAAIILGSKNK